MYNWSTNTTELAKNPQKNLIWQLEQSINFGLGKSRLSASAVAKYISVLKIDSQKKKFLEFLLS
jgi:hypothetical protein